MSVAVGVGSRGISCIYEVVRVTIEELRALGARPFLVPAMGSHGGGTSEGQQAVLKDYGLTPDALGVPIRSSLDTVQIGETPEGMPVYFDANAVQADGIIVVNRIKEHTAFKGRWESGLMKILAIGLGKARGAAQIHDWGLKDAMPAAARTILSRLPVFVGIAIVENGVHQAARIEVLRAERIETEEPALLELARRWTPRIPFEPIDSVVIREMGKEISGTGMDLNVIGMWRRNGGPIVPQIGTVAVLDLTHRSHGNAAGVGHADLISQRLYDKIDLPATYLNCITSNNFAGGKIPITLPTDREVIEASLKGLPPEHARLVLITNTLDLQVVWASESLLEIVAVTPSLEQIGPPQPPRFDSEGSLIPPGMPDVRASED
jgi:hypothetical protein